MQAVAAEEPQQVARHQVGDLRITVEHLGNQVLAEVLGADRVAWQLGQQFVEAFEEQAVVVLRNLLGFAQGAENGAQVLEQGEMMVEIGVGHGGPPGVKLKRQRSI
ncbi:hypothetical protein D9M71_240790 [compost metagenome]